MSSQFKLSSLSNATYLDKDLFKQSSRTSIKVFLFEFGSHLRLWRNRHQQRQALSKLSSLQLKDIGLTQVDVVNEVRKPFWQA